MVKGQETTRGTLSRAVGILFGFILILCAATAQAEGTYTYDLYHPEQVMPLEAYACATFKQQIERSCAHRVRVTVTIPSTLPRPSSPYPVTDVPEEYAVYLEPSPRIQSDHAAVTRLADQLLASTKPQREVDAVAAVLTWTSNNMTHAFPNEVPDAVTCLNRKTGNCIGFTHVAAALLRHMGIPARTVRTLSVCPNCGKHGRMPDQSAEVYEGQRVKTVQYGAPNLGRTHFLRHSIVEVYFPQDDIWVLYEPQTAGPANGTNIYLRSHHDWDVETQRQCRAFSKDSRTVVEVVRPNAPIPAPTHTH